MLRCGLIRKKLRRDGTLGALAPMKDLIDAAWEKATKKFLRWSQIVVSLQDNMKVEGKHFPLQEKLKTYGRMVMINSARFYEGLASVSGPEEGMEMVKPECNS